MCIHIQVMGMNALHRIAVCAREYEFIFDPVRVEGDNLELM